MASTEEEINPYELLGIQTEATEGEIKTAYRQRSLKVHPDRNRGNPNAARKFHELNQAYELLLDPLRRLALDAKIRIVQARKQRFAKYDAKRKNLVEELEERERAFKKAKTEKDAEEQARTQEAEKIKDEGRRMREEREKEMQRRDEEAERAAAAAREELQPPPLGQLDATVRLRYTLSAHPGLTSPEALAAYLTPFGTIDAKSIVLSVKPPKKAPHKPPKTATALVPFHCIADAHAAVCASGRAERRMGDIEVSWAGGEEPAILGWLKKMGKLDDQPQNGVKTNPMSTPDVTQGSLPQHSQSKASSAETPFSTFPSTFPDLPTSAPPSSAPGVHGLDYEALTLMRLRQAERERLEREILEQESNEP